MLYKWKDDHSHNIKFNFTSSLQSPLLWSQNPESQYQIFSASNQPLIIMLFSRLAHGLLLCFQIMHSSSSPIAVPEPSKGEVAERAALPDGPLLPPSFLAYTMSGSVRVISVVITSGVTNELVQAFSNSGYNLGSIMLAGTATAVITTNAMRAAFERQRVYFSHRTIGAEVRVTTILKFEFDRVDDMTWRLWAQRFAAYWGITFSIEGFEPTNNNEWKVKRSPTSTSEEAKVIAYIMNEPLPFLPDDQLAALNITIPEKSAIVERALCYNWDTRWVKNTQSYGVRWTSLDAQC